MQKIAKLAAALVVVIALFLAVGSVTGSNMGFKLEKSFEVIPGNGNNYFTSFPFFASFPDTNDSPDYVPTPNGMVDSEDALRDMWEGTGTMLLQRVDNSAGVNKLVFTGIQLNVFSGLVEIFGDEVFLLEIDGGIGGDTDRPAEGYIVQVAGPPTCVNQGDPDCPVNQSIIVGSHDVSFDTAGLTMQFVPTNKNFYLINVPYHTTYTDTANVLCGPESGFTGRDGNSDPVDGGGAIVCPAGTFNGENRNLIYQFDNTKPPFGGLNFRGVQINIFTGLVEFFGDSHWNLTPGEGYYIEVTGNGATGVDFSNFRSTHF